MVDHGGRGEEELNGRATWEVAVTGGMEETGGS